MADKLESSRRPAAPAANSAPNGSAGQNTGLLRNGPAPNTPREPTLHSLPDEVLSTIFWPLPSPAMSAIGQTCKQFSALSASFKDYMGLQQRINGLKAGLESWFPNNGGDKANKNKIFFWEDAELAALLVSHADRAQRMQDALELLTQFPGWKDRLPDHVFSITVDSLFDHVLYLLKGISFNISFKLARGHLMEAARMDDLPAVVTAFMAAVAHWRPGRKAAVIAELAQLSLGKTIRDFLDQHFEDSEPTDRAAILKGFSHSCTPPSVWSTLHYRLDLADKWFGESGISPELGHLVVSHFIAALRQSAAPVALQPGTQQPSDFLQHQHHWMLQTLFKLTSGHGDEIALNIALLKAGIPVVFAALAKEKNESLLPPSAKLAMNMANLIRLIITKAKGFPASARHDILLLADSSCTLNKLTNLSGKALADALNEEIQAAACEVQKEREVASGLLRLQSLADENTWRLLPLAVQLPAPMQAVPDRTSEDQREKSDTQDRLHETPRRKS